MLTGDITDAQQAIDPRVADLVQAGKARVATFIPNRYSRASLSFQVAAAIGGGFAPIIATALAAYNGGTAGVSIMLTFWPSSR